MTASKTGTPTAFAIDSTQTVDAGTVVGGIIAAAVIGGFIALIAIIVVPAVLAANRMKKNRRGAAFRPSSRTVMNTAPVRVSAAASTRAFGV